ncbi:beta-ketoacyl synthase [Pseudohaliea sp.]|uniref:beta-ketoacyl synthase n=1 Tax=Pseudohaliea sp. TaxID=2740289 RepID=UPI0032EE2C14
MGQPLPVIVASGGINSAGRTSGGHAYARLVAERLPAADRGRMLDALRQLRGLPATAAEAEVLAGTLIRRLEPAYFDPAAMPCGRRMRSGGERPLVVDMPRRSLPVPLPPGWTVEEEDATHARVVLAGPQEFIMPATREFEVKVASQLPSGFDPAAQYPSRNHPRGLQLAIYAASDALGDLGIPWELLRERVAAEQVSVYAGSAMGQLDEAGTGGMLKARVSGQRATSKYCPLGLAEMPADFLNAYVLGSLGATGASLGACASFLYNLRHAVHDIRSGRARVAIVGAAEAPIIPEVMEGYAAMGALATDKALRQLDGLGADAEPDYRRACRPFADNCGFTIAESAQVVVLFDDALALELGAALRGSVVDVFVNADGYKKSISGPGVGNYVTVARALAAARAVLGEKTFRRGGLLQAHGTGTPQNRTTESQILSRCAGAFGLEDLPVAALKCYLGHSLGAASADQVTVTLDTWRHGIVPGIATIDGIADDVTDEHLAFCLEHTELAPSQRAWAVVNAKGFGGNNASGTLLGPDPTQRMLEARHGARALAGWERASEAVAERRAAHEAAVLAGEATARYLFDHDVLGDGDVSFEEAAVTVGGARIDLGYPSPFADMHSDD